MGRNLSHLIPSVPIFFHPGGGFEAELMPFGCPWTEILDSGAIVSHFVPFLTLRRRRVCRGGHRAEVKGWEVQGFRGRLPSQPIGRGRRRPVFRGSRDRVPPMKVCIYVHFRLIEGFRASYGAESGRQRIQFKRVGTNPEYRGVTGPVKGEVSLAFQNAMAWGEFRAVQGSRWNGSVSSNSSPISRTAGITSRPNNSRQRMVSL